jgi:hypothetical protein
VKDQETGAFLKKSVQKTSAPWRNWPIHVMPGHAGIYEFFELDPNSWKPGRCFLK